MRFHVKFFLFILCLPLVLLLALYLYVQYEQQEKKESNTIYIGIAWPDYDSFIDGAELAVSEANEAGGVLDKKIQLVINTDEAKAVAMLEKESSMLIGDRIKEPSRKVARYFANYSPKITAVIGHGYSFMAVAAASLYEQKKIVFITPSATNDILTSMGFACIFRMMPKNSVQGHQLGSYSVAKKIKRAVVFYERTEYAFELGQAFRQFAARHGIDIVLQFPFLQIKNEFAELPRCIAAIKKIHKEDPVDAVFIFTGGVLAEKIVHECCKRNIDNVQFVAGESANDDGFWEEVEKNSVKASTPSMFNRNNTDALVQNFKKKFTEVYDDEPDYVAALGYDSINLLLNAIKNAGSNDTVDVANEIRYMSPCRGVTGRIAFDENGDPDYKFYLMKSTGENGFEYHDLNGKILKSFEADTAKLPECAAFIRKQ